MKLLLSVLALVAHWFVSGFPQVESKRIDPYGLVPLPALQVPISAAHAPGYGAPPAFVALPLGYAHRHSGKRIRQKVGGNMRRVSSKIKNRLEGQSFFQETPPRPQLAFNPYQYPFRENGLVRDSPGAGRMFGVYSSADGAPMNYEESLVTQLRQRMVAMRRELDSMSDLLDRLSRAPSQSGPTLGGSYPGELLSSFAAVSNVASSSAGESTANERKMSQSELGYDRKLEEAAKLKETQTKEQAQPTAPKKLVNELQSKAKTTPPAKSQPKSVTNNQNPGHRGPEAKKSAEGLQDSPMEKMEPSANSINTQLANQPSSPPQNAEATKKRGKGRRRMRRIASKIKSYSSRKQRSAGLGL